MWAGARSGEGLVRMGEPAGGGNQGQAHPRGAEKQGARVTSIFL